MVLTKAKIFDDFIIQFFPQEVSQHKLGRSQTYSSFADIDFIWRLTWAHFRKYL